MLRYAIRRLILIIPVLLLVYTVVFALLRLVPGGPWDQEKPLPPAVVASLNQKYGLDRPLWEQYLSYLGGVLRGDLGVSYSQGEREVARIITDFFPVSLQLGLLAMVIAVALGLTAGAISALHHNSWIDQLVMFVTVLGVSVPHFVLASLLVLVFAVSLQLLPAGGWDGVLSPRAIIPATALALAPAARIARFARASLLDIIRTDYIRTAYAKGLRQRSVVTGHALKNALIPVVTVIGVNLGFIVTGSFFVETVCVVPGLGRYFVTSIVNRDYPVVLGTVLLLATIVSLLNLFVDLLYGYLDPRIRYE